MYMIDIHIYSYICIVDTMRIQIFSKFFFNRYIIQCMNTPFCAAEQVQLMSLLSSQGNDST